MRETRSAQTSMYQFYSEHTLGKRLRALSDLLDEHPEIIELIEQDFRVPDTAATGACGFSVESVFR